MTINIINKEVAGIKDILGKQQEIIGQLLSTKEEKKSDSEEECIPEGESNKGEPLSKLFTPPKAEVVDDKEMLRQYATYKLGFVKLVMVFQGIRKDKEIMKLEITEAKDRQELLECLLFQMSTWSNSKAEISEEEFKALMYDVEQVLHMDTQG